MSCIPEKAKEVLAAYFPLLEQKLPHRLKAYYLIGSISLGEFTYTLSDIDFVAVIDNTMSQADLKALKEVHHKIKRQSPKADLMGYYVTENDLKAGHENTVSCPVFIDGTFKGYQKFERNSADAYQLKRYGITVMGQEAASLDYTVDLDILTRNTRENLSTYWLNWKKGCEKFPSLKFFGLFLRLEMVEWGVLGCSRLYYTLRERDITSKISAGDYALKTVPQRWHRILHESMRLRSANKKSYYKSVIQRRNDALAYIEYLIKNSTM